MQECTKRDKINFLISDLAPSKDSGVCNKVIGNTKFTGNAVMFYIVYSGGSRCTGNT